jgi:hypothetical protein
MVFGVHDLEKDIAKRDGKGTDLGRHKGIVLILIGISCEHDGSRYVVRLGL